MNRGGLSGLVNEFDDRFTGHTAAALEALGADGGKMLTRICLGDPDTVCHAGSDGQGDRLPR